MVKAFELTVEPALIQPTLVFGHPVEISPLAKPMAEDPRFAERFEIFIAGMECGDNWSEQNDPAHLLETFRRAYRAEERDTGKFHTLDFDFIEALEYGMPPTTGIGPGVERMAMIFTEQENIDDVIFFPMMRPSVSPLNAAIYGIAEAGARAGGGSWRCRGRIFNRCATRAFSNRTPGTWRFTRGCGIGARWRRRARLTSKAFCRTACCGWRGSKSPRRNPLLKTIWCNS